MNNVPDFIKSRSKSRYELLILIAVGIVIFAWAVWANAFEQLAVFAEQHDPWLLDGLTVLCPIVLLGLAVFAYRCWRESHTLQDRIAASEQSIQQQVVALNTLDQTIMNANSPEQSVLPVLEFVRQHINPFYAGVLLCDESGDTARVLAAYSQKEGHLSQKVSLDEFPPQVLDLLRSGHAYRLNDLTQCPEIIPIVRKMIGEYVSSLLWMPLLHEGQLIAMLNIAFQDAHASEQMPLLHAIQNRLRVALQHAHYREQIAHHRQELNMHFVESTAENDKNEDLYRQLVENADATISVVDYEGTFLYINRHPYPTSSGYDPGEVIGKSMWDFFPPAIAERQQTHIRRVIDTGREEAQIVGSEMFGQEFWIRANTKPLQDADGKVYAAVNYILDVTELMRMRERQHDFEMAMEKERATVLSQFMQHATHEFRTPLATIRTSAYLMTKVNDPDKIRQKAKAIDDHITRMTKLLDMSLRITQLHSNTPPVFSPVNITALLKRLADIYRASTNELTLHYTPDDTIPAVQAHEEELTELLHQIVSNAYRFTPPGGTITLRSYQTPEHVVIEVQDTGIGITDTEKDAIFKTFWRRDEAHTTPGFGLGLPIAKRIIERHNGTVEVESTVGQGSLFRILLPITQQTKNT